MTTIGEARQARTQRVAEALRSLLYPTWPPMRAGRVRVGRVLVAEHGSKFIATQRRAAKELGISQAKLSRILSARLVDEFEADFVDRFNALAERSGRPERLQRVRTFFGWHDVDAVGRDSDSASRAAESRARRESAPAGGES